MNLQKFTPGGVNRDDIFHSSAYARVAGGSSFGSTNAQTFGQRRDIHRKRQAVRHYGSSMIGQNHMGETVRPALDGSNPLRQSTAEAARRFEPRGSVGVSRSGVQAPPRPRFSEPPTRGYNPFS
jgi:hypothetical protein